MAAIRDGGSMSAAARSVLYVRLPCWKIYPGGVVYVADYVHKERPALAQHILDLAVVPPADRTRVLSERLERQRPERRRVLLAQHAVLRAASGG